MPLQDIIANILLILVILLSLSVHEYAHALVANLFGDPTAKHEGRQTINPLAHWDPVGTTLLVGLLIIRIFGLNVPVFGWGKPVPVNEDNFENPRIQGLQVAIAGPISNFVLAIIFAFLAGAAGGTPVAEQVFVSAVFINIFLMFFNLIPIPPLDGSRVLRLFMSDRAYYSLAANPLVFLILLFAVFSYLINYIAALSIFVATRLLAIF